VFSDGSSLLRTYDEFENHIVLNSIDLLETVITHNITSGYRKTLNELLFRKNIETNQIESILTKLTTNIKFYQHSKIILEWLDLMPQNFKQLNAKITNLANIDSSSNLSEVITSINFKWFKHDLLVINTDYLFFEEKSLILNFTKGRLTHQYSYDLTDITNYINEYLYYFFLNFKDKTFSDIKSQIIHLPFYSHFPIDEDFTITVFDFLMTYYKKDFNYSELLLSALDYHFPLLEYHVGRFYFTDFYSEKLLEKEMVLAGALNQKNLTTNKALLSFNNESFYLALKNYLMYHDLDYGDFFENLLKATSYFKGTLEKNFLDLLFQQSSKNITLVNDLFSQPKIIDIINPSLLSYLKKELERNNLNVKVFFPYLYQKTTFISKIKQQFNKEKAVA
jgi:hypothetical protein